MFRKLFAAFAGLILAACTTAPATNTAGTTTSPTQHTPAQVAAALCSPLEVAIAGLQADTGLPQGALHDLALAAPQVQTLCTSAALATADDAATLENLAFDVVLPIAQVQNPRLAADLLAVQIVLNVVQAVQTSQAGTPAAAAVSAAK